MADPIGLAATIVSVTSKLYEYVSSVKEAKDDIRRLSQELYALKGTLDHFEQLRGSQASLSDQQPGIEGMVRMTQEALESLRKRLARRSTAAGEVIQRLTWPFNKGDVDKFVVVVERAKTYFLMVLMGDASEITSAVYSEVQKLAAVVHEDIIERRAERMLAEVEGTIRLLTPLNPNDDHAKAAEGRVPGTGRWFFDKSFEQWSERSSEAAPLLWLTGKTGAGKTTLFSSIVDEIRTRCSQDPGSVVCAFHYCSLDNMTSQEPVNVLGAFAAALVATRPQLATKIQPMIRPTSSPIPRSSLSIAELCSVIEEGLALVERCYVLLDAINESPEQDQIVTVLLSLCQSSPNLCVLVTSTSDPRVTNPLFSVLRLASRGLDRDIQEYVQYRMSSEKNFTALSSQLQARIAEKVTGGANRTFRWAQLCMDRLGRCRTGRDILKALDDLPATLNDTYVGMLCRIAVGDKDLAREALTWLCFSARPLTLLQLAEAVVVQEHDTYLDDDLRLTNPACVVEICDGLAEVGNGDRVTLAHDSVRSFLTSEWIRGSAAAFFAVDPSDANRAIMRKCITYLMFDEFNRGHVKTVAELLVRVRGHYLSDYATTFWPSHAAAYSLTEADEKVILDFFATKETRVNGGSFESWVQMLLASIDTRSIKRTQPLYYAASFNMIPVLKILLRPGSGVEVDHPGGRHGSTAFIIACYRGHGEAAKMLLEAGANPHARDKGTYRTALSLAVSRKLDDVVKMIKASPKQTTLRSKSTDEGLVSDGHDSP